MQTSFFEIHPVEYLWDVLDEKKSDGSRTLQPTGLGCQKPQHTFRGVSWSLAVSEAKAGLRHYQGGI